MKRQNFTIILCAVYAFILFSLLFLSRDRLDKFTLDRFFSPSWNGLGIFSGLFLIIYGIVWFLKLNKDTAGETSEKKNVEDTKYIVIMISSFIIMMAIFIFIINKRVDDIFDDDTPIFSVYDDKQAIFNIRCKKTEDNTQMPCFIEINK